MLYAAFGIYHIHVSISACMCVCVHVSMCVYVCVCVCVCVCAQWVPIGDIFYKLAVDTMNTSLGNLPLG